jgi:two-component system chemotaxis sensor kinase CheA
VRNAVDHAIESPDERIAAGKPRGGAVRVRCVELGGSQVAVSVEDDGRGIDREAVARRAGRAIADDRELLAVLATPGFSTRDVASRTSGRGLGMDIVKRIAVDVLGGELAVASERGAGTAFTLRVPVTISVVEVFSFECGPQAFVVPVSTVDEIFELAPGEAMQPPAARGARSPMRMIERRGHAVPLLSLGATLAIDNGAGARKAILTRRAGEPVAFAVDRMLGRHEVVVRPIDDPLVRVPGVTGATDLGTGTPTLVLDLGALELAVLELAARGEA